MCSTPCDISDPFTLQPVGRELSSGCAQRLATSQIHSPKDTEALHDPVSLCSTPCDISDPFTGDVDGAQVLTEWCSTPFDISDPFTLVNRLNDFPNGPVLNAFGIADPFTQIPNPQFFQI